MLEFLTGKCRLFGDIERKTESRRQRLELQNPLYVVVVLQWNCLSSLDLCCGSFYASWSEEVQSANLVVTSISLSLDRRIYLRIYIVMFTPHPRSLLRSSWDGRKLLPGGEFGRIGIPRDGSCGLVEGKEVLDLGQTGGGRGLGFSHG